MKKITLLGLVMLGAVSAGAETVSVTSWSELTTALSGGKSVTLGADIVQDGGEFQFASDQVVTLDLAGRTLTAATGKRVFNLNSSGCELTLDDSVGSGKITRGDVFSGDGGLLCASAGHLILKGGTFTAKVSNYGGVACMTGSSRLTVNGGTVTGCEAPNGGCAFYLGAGVSGTMNGGTISSCKGSAIVVCESFTVNDGTFTDIAGASGGAFYVARYTGNLTVNCGTFSNCTASEDGGIIKSWHTTTINGGVFKQFPDNGFCRAEGTFTVNGGVFDSSNVTKKSASLGSNCSLTAVGGLYVVGRCVGVSGNSLSRGTFTFDPSASLYTSAGLTIASDREILPISDGCYTLTQNVSNWNDLKNALASGQSVKLTADITQEGDAIALNSAQVVTIDLNGHSVKRVGNVRLFNNSNSTLTIKDSVGNGRFYPDSTKYSYRGAFANLSGSAQLILESGTIDGFSANGTTGSVDEGTGGAFEVQSGSTLTMYGGTIKNCSAVSKGGAVNVLSGGKFTMNGGAIENCTASNYGGGVHNGGTLTVNGGTFSGCQAIYHDGGAIRAGSGATTKIYGGSFLNNHADGYGGAVQADQTEVNFYGGYFSGNTVRCDMPFFDGDWDNTRGHLWGCVVNGYNPMGSNPCDCDLQGGSQSVAVGSFYVIGRDVTSRDGKLTGGTFSFDPSDKAYSDGGFKVACYASVKDNGDGTWTVTASSETVAVSDWSDLTDALRAGVSVQLAADITQADAAVELNDGQAVTLDLNGHSVQRVGKVRVFSVYNSKLTIKDSAGNGRFYPDSTLLPYRGAFANLTGSAQLILESGTIDGFSANGEAGTYDEGAGGAFEVQSGATLTMNGGTIKNCAANTKGGAVDVLSGGTFAMNGGVITNCSASTNGGAINTAGTLTIDGGTIRDCTASGNGSAIRAEGSSSVATINGGVILNSAAGGAIVTDGNARVTVNGSAFDDEGMLDYGADLGDDWELNGIGLTPNFVIGRNVEFEGDKVAKGIFAFDPTQPEYAAAGLVLKDDAKVCENSDGTFAVNAIADWGHLKAVLEAGESVRLGDNITQDGDEITLSANQAVKLDLNGFTLTAASGKRAFNLNSASAELTITDTSAGATGKITRNDELNGNGGIIFVTSGHLILNGGTFTGKTVDGSSGGFAYVENNSAARITMNGGTVTGCKGRYGGALVISGSAVATINGGVISNCTCISDGGAILCNGTLTVNGGTIVDCTASQNGGAIQIEKTTGRLTVNGGTIAGCTAVVAGSAIQAEQSSVMTINGGTIMNCSAGGTIHVEGATATLNGGVYNDANLLNYGAALGANWTFTKAGSTANYVIGRNIGFEGDAIVRGTFTFDPTDAEYAAAGLTLGSISTVFDNGDGTWSVKTPWDEIKEAMLSSGVAMLSGDVTQDGDEFVLAGDEVVTLDLAGHTLTAATGKRLFNLNSSGCVLTITNSGMIAKGLITRGDTFGDKGGIAYVASGHLVLNAGVFTGKSSSDGGFAYVGNDGRVTMNGGKIADCTCVFDGGAFYVKDGEITMNGGVITDCTAGDDSGAIRATNARVTINGGLISNCGTESTGNAITLYASSLTMNGGVIECADGAPIAVTNGGTATLNGGVFDEGDILGEGIATGTGWTFAAVGTTGLYVIGKEVVVNDNRIAEGTFTFNPRGGEYFTAGLPLAAWTVAEQNADGTYTLKVVDGKTFYAEVNGVVCLFKTQNGVAVLGDGTTNAVDTATTMFTIPHFATGLLVTDIAPNAFKDCTALKYIFFDDAPLASAGGATFAETTVGVYRPSLASLWEPILEDGKWMEALKMEKKYCDTWSKLCDNLSCGVDAELVCNISQDGDAAVFNGGAATLKPGGYRLNGIAGTPTISAASGTLSVYDGLFAAFSAEEAGGTLALCGGVYDDDPSEWVADGYESIAYDGDFIIAKAGSFATNNAGEMTRGTFTFDSEMYNLPRADYTAISTIAAVSPKLCVVGIPDGTEFTETIAGVDCTVKIVGVGAEAIAQIGDGTNPAVDAATRRFAIPAKICGYPVTAIAAKAFTDCTDLEYLLFEGNPPTLEDGAIPSGTVISYLAENSAAWEAEITDGKWHGLTASYETCATWKKVCDNLASGEKVILLGDIVQDGAAAVPSGSPCLDLAGHTLTQAADATLFEIADGVTLTISNVVASVSSETNGWMIGVASESPTFDIAIGGTVTVAGGNYRDTSFFADGHADVLGGVWHGGNTMERGANGALHVYGGIFNARPLAYFPAGVVSIEWEGRYLVLKNDGYGLDDNGAFYSGGFTFDPTAADYRVAGIKIAPDTAIVSEAGDPPISRVVPLDDEVTYWAHLPEADIRFTIEDNMAILGDGNEAIVTNTELGALSIPAKLAGFPVGVIRANAFKGVKPLAYLEFQGPPVATVEEGAFTGPTNLVMTLYTGDYADEWLGAIGGVDGGQWHGLAMTRGNSCRTWKGVCRNFLDGYGAQLAANVRQGDGDLVFGPAITNKLDVGDHMLFLTRQLATVPNGKRFVLSGTEKGMVLGGGRGATALPGDSTVTGGCVRVAAGGAFEMADARIVGAQAEVGGAVAVDAGGSFEMNGGRIAGCRATYGAGVAAAGSVTVTDGAFAYNQAEGVAAGGAIYLANGGTAEVKDGSFLGNTGFGGAIHNAGGRVTVWGGEFEGNLAADGEQGSLAVVTDGGRNDVYGGTYLRHAGTPCVVTDGTLNHYGSVADIAVPSSVEGYEETQLGDIYVTHVAGTLSAYTNHEVMAGVFTFDPREEEYAAAGLTLLPECTVTEATEDGVEQYAVSIVEGGPYEMDLLGEHWIFRIVNGEVVLGDGTRAAMADTAATAVAIPVKLNGMRVRAIDAAAFTNFLYLTDIVFEGAPIDVLSPQAFDGRGGTVQGSYSPAYADEWQEVIANGKWQGIAMSMGRCLDWEVVKQNLLAGNDVTFLGDIGQTSGAAAFASGILELDLNGFELKGLAGNRVFELSDIAVLHVTDSVGGGVIRGAGEFEGIGGFASVNDSATMYLEGGEVTGWSAERGGALYVDTNAVVQIEGTDFSDCSAAYGGMATVAGSLRVYRTTVSGAKATADGGAIYVESTGLLRMVGGTDDDETSEDCTIEGCLANGNGGAIASVGSVVFAGGVLTGNQADLGGGGIAVLGGAAQFNGGRFVKNTAKTGDAVYSLNLTVPVYGGCFSDYEGETCGIANDGGVLKVTGGVFTGDLPANSLQSGWQAYDLDDGLKLVAKADSLSYNGASELLTAGVFTFDPSSSDLNGLIVTDPYRQYVVETGGSPATWTLRVNFTVECTTWAELKANVLAGNKVSLAIDFNPPRQKQLPQGFVYRGRAMDGDEPAANLDDLKVTVKIYENEKGGVPLWWGVQENVKTDTNGTFQVWIDDNMRYLGATNLVELFDAGKAGYLGIAFDDGSECSPRRAMITAPTANRANTAANLDSIATVGVYDGRGGTLTCDTLTLSSALCGTLEITTTNTSFNVAEINAAGATLYRHEDNRIVSRHPGSWQYVTVRPNDTLLVNAPKSCLLTVQSTNDCSVPLLTFPVPTGGNFIWRSTPFSGRMRVTNIGE